jgi:Protein of unknown function (DUF1822)
MTSNPIDYAVPLPLTSRAFQVAREFSAQQPTPEKAEQVKLNTLAVWVVNEYLQMMGISTDVEASDSWNPVLRLCADVADLEVINAGRLECRPVRVSETSCHIPQEVGESRIGYAIVQIDEAEQQANLLGFAPAYSQEILPIAALQPPEDLLDRLHDRLDCATSPVRTATAAITHLSQWFDNLFETGWQAAEALLNSGELNPGFAFRGFDVDGISQPLSLKESSDDRLLLETGIRRVKLIDLGVQLSSHRVGLLIEIKPTSQTAIEIGVQVHPLDNQTYLPPDLQLIVVDESCEVFMEAKSRSADNYIQLQFSGQPGEGFEIQLKLNEVSITEQFTI